MRPIAVLALMTVLQSISIAQQRFPASVAISTPTPIARSGTEIRLNVSVEDKSDHVLRILKSPDGHAEAVNRVEVFNSDGARLPLTNGIRHWLSIKSTSLAPGESYDSFLILSELFDLRKPGTYSVTVRHELLQLDAPKQEDRKLFVPSNSLEITVTN